MEQNHNSAVHHTLYQRCNLAECNPHSILRRKTGLHFKSASSLEKFCVVELGFTGETIQYFAISNFDRSSVYMFSWCPVACSGMLVVSWEAALPWWTNSVFWYQGSNISLLTPLTPHYPHKRFPAGVKIDICSLGQKWLNNCEKPNRTNTDKHVAQILVNPIYPTYLPQETMNLTTLNHTVQIICAYPKSFYVVYILANRSYQQANAAETAVWYSSQTKFNANFFLSFYSKSSSSDNSNRWTAAKFSFFSYARNAAMLSPSSKPKPCSRPIASSSSSVHTINASRPTYVVIKCVFRVFYGPGGFVWGWIRVLRAKLYLLGFIVYTFLALSAPHHM